MDGTGSPGKQYKSGGVVNFLFILLYVTKVSIAKFWLVIMALYLAA